MKEIIGTSNRILWIDLTTKEHTVIEIDDEDRSLYLGGKGLGLKLLSKHLEPGIDPLGPQNIIAFMTGVLLGTGAPCSGRFTAVSKSPLTGIMNCSSCGGPFGMALKTSGWDGLIVTGKCSNPSFLVIDSLGAEFQDAHHLWGLDTLKTQEMLEQAGSGSMVIGPAGENRVPFANIRSGHRFFGRGGMGAVLGSKNLKAIVARGKEYRILPKNNKNFTLFKKRLLKYIEQNQMTSKTYRKYGTLGYIKPANNAGILPVRNFTLGSHGEALKISGEDVADRFQTTHSTCKPCSILCGHKGKFAGTIRQVPEYESAGLLGPNLEIFDPVLISQWNEICSLSGIDTVSAGGTIAWAMEAGEKGLFQTKLKFGTAEGISQTLMDIAHRRGIGKELALGSRVLAWKYGGADFAMHVKGLELAAYDPRGCYGQGLSFAVANKGGDHLSSYVLALENFFNMINPFTLRGKAYLVKFLENIYAALNSLVICQFTAYPVFLEPPLVRYTPHPILKLLVQNFTPLAMSLMDISLWPKLWSAVTGLKMNMATFKLAGERIHILERVMNTREGISRDDDTLPGRLLVESRLNDHDDRRVPLSEMLNRYYRLRGYDQRGIPTKKKLKSLGISTT